MAAEYVHYLNAIRTARVCLAESTRFLAAISQNENRGWSAIGPERPPCIVIAENGSARIFDGSVINRGFDPLGQSSIRREAAAAPILFRF